MVERQPEITHIADETAKPEPLIESSGLGERLTEKVANRLLSSVLGDLTRYSAEEKTRRQTSQL